MISLTGKSLITRSIPPNDHCFYMPSFFFSFGFEHFVNKKRYQDRYEREVNLSTNVYTEHGEQNWNSSTNSANLDELCKICSWYFLFYVEIWIKIIIIIENNLILSFVE